ncbi:oligopeptidase A [Salmonella enterica subsp. enterica]|uniref:Oligopeptidase A n=1 Tax=Salmonella enterica I TaxID=59201 RepID=A0A379W2K3_SALET|nr:oligopeptidase A [Salmonella enterica subsp. enterica]
MSSYARTSGNKAVNGLFEVVKRIYGITAKERTDVDVWHPEVRFFELYDENNELRGSFYLDLYAREHKRGGRGWTTVSARCVRRTAHCKSRSLI